jgi:hypothetical protein
MNHGYEFFRVLFIVVGVMAIINWSRHGRRWPRRHRSFQSAQDHSGADLAALESRLSTVEALEARVAELENRLDFAERLMAGRGEPPAADARQPSAFGR